MVKVLQQYGLRKDLQLNAELFFWQTHALEAHADGAVIEISTDNGNTFTDLANCEYPSKRRGLVQESEGMAGLTEGRYFL